MAVERKGGVLGARTHGPENPDEMVTSTKCNSRPWDSRAGQVARVLRPAWTTPGGRVPLSRCVAVRWMLALLFLLPAVARAGEGPRWERSWLMQAPVVDTPPRLLPDPVPVAPPVHPLWQRLLVEGGAGVGTGLAGALVGVGLYMLGSGLQLFEPGEDPAVLPFALVGAALGFPLGVWWGGELMAGDGSLLATFGGAAVGGLAAVGLWACRSARASRSPASSRAWPSPCRWWGPSWGTSCPLASGRRRRGSRCSRPSSSPPATGRWCWPAASEDW